MIQPLAIPDQGWEDATIDFSEGLPTSQGKNAIMVVVDWLSKYDHFLMLTLPYTTNKVTTMYVEGIVKLHGMSSSIVSDWDTIFMSLFWKEYFKLQGTQLRTDTTYHPQTNGQMKVVN